MARILITSGPTREYLDPVRFLTNGSSGQMGAALAQAVLHAGHQPLIVTGPVATLYPNGAEIWPVETTREMLTACQKLFPDCWGVIGAAAPCDYRPESFSTSKISKKNRPSAGLTMHFVETPDILAALGHMKRSDQWSVGFALETENGPAHALEKLRRKNCDFIVLNSLTAMNSDKTELQIFDSSGQQQAVFCGSKNEAAAKIVQLALGK